MKTVQIIGAASGRGAKDRRCEAGPDALRYDHGLVPRLRQQGIPVTWKGTAQPSVHSDNAVTAVQTLCMKLSQMISTAIAGDELFAVLGGDHSCAIGTWSGAVQARRDAGPVGLVWIDAHMDSHTPETSPSGALHGMPLACLLGRGEPRLTMIAGPCPKLLPAHVVLIGVHSFEPEEHLLLRRLGVKIFFMEEVRRRGLDRVFQEALEVVRGCTAGFGVSIDLDAIDPEDAPAVGTPVSGGIAKEKLIASLQQLSSEPHFLGLEIAEYNPALDKEQLTASLIRELLASAFAETSCKPIYD